MQSERTLHIKKVINGNAPTIYLEGLDEFTHQELRDFAALLNKQAFQIYNLNHKIEIELADNKLLKDEKNNVK